MKRIVVFLTLVPLLAWCQALSAELHSARSAENMVATVHPLATDAAVDALQQGGNAIDAAIAAALTLGVVDGFNSGIGGGCFILIRTADGRLIALDGREMAPAAAHRDMYLRDGKPNPQLSLTGPLAIGVPGAVCAYEQAVVRYGKLPFAALLRRSADLAEEGFVVNDVYADRLASVAEDLRRFEGSRRALLKPDGSPYCAGERLQQPDLAATYRAIASRGTDWFYHGEFAQRASEWLQENGGIITVGDFGNYQTVDRKPLQTTYRGYQIVGFPPPSSGGVHVAQILNILEQFDLRAMHQQDPVQVVHVVAEAMKLAFADRAHWLGDPDHVDVPVGLVDKQYASQLAGRIDRARTIPVPSYSTPPGWENEFFEKHTTHIAAADKQGNWVAVTTTVNTTFGSKVIIPGLGVVMNNQMDDFSIAPGTPNAYGLVGSQANSIAAGKRPLSSMSPTIVLRDGQPVLTVGAAGGPKIITQVVLAIVGRLDLGIPLDQAVANPRIHHQWLPDRLMIESSLNEGMRTGLQQLGHRPMVSDAAGITQAIEFDEPSGTFFGVHDPRTPGKAGGQ